MTRSILCAVLLTAALAPMQSRAADAESNALADCLSRSASAADRTSLVQGIFSAVVTHPDLAAIATVDAARRDAIAARAAQVLQRLVAQDCRLQARASLANGGLAGVRGALGTLGEQALADFTDHPDVQAGLGDVLRHVDAGTVLEALLSQ